MPAPLAVDGLRRAACGVKDAHRATASTPDTARLRRRTPSLRSVDNSAAARRASPRTSTRHRASRPQRNASCRPSGRTSGRRANSPWAAATLDRRQARAGASTPARPPQATADGRAARLPRRRGSARNPSRPHDQPGRERRPNRVATPRQLRRAQQLEGLACRSIVGMPQRLCLQAFVVSASKGARCDLVLRQVHRRATD
jgi:hypothetical protein